VNYFARNQSKPFKDQYTLKKTKVNLDLLSTINLSQFFNEVLLYLIVPFCRNYSTNNSKKHPYIKNILKHALKIYTDPVNQRKLIREDNIGKIGVYA
jgi:hypothetical protein